MTTHKRSRITILAGWCICFLGTVAFSQNSRPAYLDPSLPLEKRIDDLLSRMTVEEKVAQLRSEIRNDFWAEELAGDGLGGIGPVLRPLKAADAAKKANEIQRLASEKKPLGIPVIIHDEALHGLVGNGATAFPQAIGLAATWNPALMTRIGSAIGKETRSRGIRQVLSPVVNIARDARWGRVEETFGEDPYLTSLMGAAFCASVEAEGVVTTPKHFIANYGDGGRDSYPANVSVRELWEVYFPPFEACFKLGHAQSVMASYNAFDGTPCSADEWLLRTVLRKVWGFDGFAVSDYGSVIGIRTMHAVAPNDTVTAKLAVEAGLNVELPDVLVYGKPLMTGAKNGSISATALDRAVREVLRVKFRLGLFENHEVDPKKAEELNDSPEHRALALESAREAIVLLKNEKNVLPLRKDLKSIAVIGPRAEGAWLGGYSGTGMQAIDVLDGIRNKLGDRVTVRFETGCVVGAGALPAVPSLNLLPPNARPGEHGLRGEYFANRDLTGKPALTRIDARVKFNWQDGSPDSTLPADKFSVRWKGSLLPTVTGTYRLGIFSDDGARVWIDGKQIINSWTDRAATLDAAPMHLDSGRVYDLRIEYYENGGSARAEFVWEMRGEENVLRNSAVAAAKKSDAAVIVAGITEGEGRDRSSLDLPDEQEALINAVAATGTPTVVVLVAGSPVTMKGWIDEAPAIVDAWYPGEEGGNAVADVLFGDYNPGGKLPITFPQTVGQVPLYYSHKPTGRGDGYVDLSGNPQFPFGFGLSYTTFEYSNLTLSSPTIDANGRLTVSCTVRNAGTKAGDEVVQLYLRDYIASVTRPVKELKGFSRIHLEPGASTRVSFTIGRSELEMRDKMLNPVVEPGDEEVQIGSSSEDIRLRSTFTIVQ